MSERREPGRMARALRSSLRPMVAALSWLVIGGSGVNAHAQPAPDAAKTEPAEERLSIHGQSTFVEQGHPAFHSPYTGPLSLDPGRDAKETLSVSLVLGTRLWQGAEVSANPELLQGFGMSNSTGIAGFANGEAFKVGSTGPLGKVSRVFLRQTFALGNDGTDRMTITVGKYAVVDIFDDNRYAHDSRAGFLNWTINELGAFDMASPAFNYTYGATAEWYRARWAVRAGFFLEPTHPNSEDIDTTFRQVQPLGELEERHEVWSQPGKLKLLVFGKHVDAGRFSQAVTLSEATGQPPSTALVRNGVVWGYGAGLNLEQQLTADLGMFARASAQTGQFEEFSFTQVQESVSAGLVLGGAQWGRDHDVVGLGAVVNGIFAPEQAYLAAGGTGIIIGDGALNYGREEIVELYYKLVPWEWAAITADYQFVNHPAYNQDRGPVSVFGARVHLEF